MNVYEAAIERVADAIRAVDTVVVSFSGGKDSTATLHVTKAAADRLKRKIEIMFIDEEAVAPETVDYVERVRTSGIGRMTWVCAPVKHRNAASRRQPFWYPWAEEDREKWVRQMPAEHVGERDIVGFRRTSISDLAGLLYPSKAYGRVAMCLGLRSQESMTRRSLMVSNHRRTGKAYVAAGDYKHITNVYPIFEWVHEDVWFAPYTFKWDYNRAYDLMAAAGLPLNVQRVAPPFGEQPVQNLWMWHVCWPELWGRMVDRVPGAATAKRYSRTSLYGFGGVVKADGVSWRDAIYNAVSLTSPDYREPIVTSLRVAIARHQAMTPDPIPDEEPHPVSGYSWKMLAPIAMRGDIKGGRIGRNVINKAFENAKASRAERADVRRSERAAD